MKYSCTVDEYKQKSAHNKGICLYCGRWQNDVEPDATNLTCFACGMPEVMGAEQALLENRLDIVSVD